MSTLTAPKPKDWVASLVVFIIAMPLSLGIALASGASPAAGLVTAVAGGIIAGILAGAPLSVTGPAAGLTAIVFQLVQEYGLDGLAIITVICGVLQLIMGLARTGKVFTWIPTLVLEGVLSAIGVIIVLGQLHVLAGAPIPKSPILAALSLPQSYAAAIGAEGLWLTPVLLCGLLAIGFQLAWNKWVPTTLKWLPAALPAVVLITALSLFWDMPRVALEPFMSVIESATGKFFAGGWMSELSIYVVPAIGLAIVASAESLLTARAIDILVSARPHFKPSNLNRELIAQGAANLTSGVIGGIPMTGVMVRSAANVNAGGETRWSTILHGLWIALFVILAPGLLAKIPLTALAAILILTGWKLINLKHFVHSFKENAVGGLIWFGTTAAVFTTDLLKGLIIGILIYVAFHSKQIWNRLKGAQT
jgi:MFS superfamily sulfate permease-like transporter